MGLEPTTSGLDLPVLYRLSYEASTGASRGKLGSEFRGIYSNDRYIVVETRSTRDIEILFKLIVKVPVVGNTADTPNLPALLPF